MLRGTTGSAGVQRSDLTVGCGPVDADRGHRRLIERRRGCHPRPAPGRDGDGGRVDGCCGTGRIRRTLRPRSGRHRRRHTPNPLPPLTAPARRKHWFRPAGKPRPPRQRFAPRPPERSGGERPGHGDLRCREGCRRSRRARPLRPRSATSRPARPRQPGPPPRRPSRSMVRRLNATLHRSAANPTRRSWNGKCQPDKRQQARRELCTSGPGR